MPEPYSLAIVLVDIEGFSYKEIAEMTRVSGHSDVQDSAGREDATAPIGGLLPGC